jgi:hypothetical protein
MIRAEMKFNVVLKLISEPDKRLCSEVLVLA